MPLARAAQPPSDRWRSGARAPSWDVWLGPTAVGGNLVDWMAGASIDLIPLRPPRHAEMVGDRPPDPMGELTSPGARWPHLCSRDRGYEAISPDGGQLVFVASVGSDQSQLWLQSLDSTEPVPLAGTSGFSTHFGRPTR